MISRIRIASVGRDLGIQIYEQEMREWHESQSQAAPEPPITNDPSTPNLHDSHDSSTPNLHDSHDSSTPNLHDSHE